MDILREIFLVIISLGIPFYFIIRWNGKGVLYGTLAMWFMVYAIGEGQRAGNPYTERFGLGVWVFIGWLLSFIYCLFIYCGKKLFIKYKKQLLPFFRKLR